MSIVWPAMLPRVMMRQIRKTRDTVLWCCWIFRINNDRCDGKTVMDLTRLSEAITGCCDSFDHYRFCS